MITKFRFLENIQPYIFTYALPKIYWDIWRYGVQWKKMTGYAEVGQIPDIGYLVNLFR
jgi:hypothetical protein